MMSVAPRCKKCKRQMTESYLNDKGDENFAQFFITYCPNCIELGDFIPVTVWGHTSKKEKIESPKPTPKFKVSKSKKTKHKPKHLLVALGPIPKTKRRKTTSRRINRK